MLPFVKNPVLYWLEIAALAAFLIALVSALMRKGPTRSWTHLARAARHISARHARRAVELSGDGIVVADLRRPDFPIVYANPAFETITGHRQDSSIGNSTSNVFGADSPFELDAIRTAMQERQATRVTLSLRREDGKPTRNDLYVEPQFGAMGRATHCIGTLREAEPAQRAAAVRQHRDSVDRLTGVASRNSFQDHLAQMLRREGGEYTVLAKIDIRRFHDINTSFGHPAGDSVLFEVAQRLRKLPDAVVGRLSGNEFAVAAPLQDPDRAIDVISSLKALLEAKFQLSGAPFKVRFAIGYALGQRADESTVVLRHAGVALHEAKASPFLDVRKFDRNAANRNENRARLTRDLQHAMQHGELLLYYQPKVELATGEITGAEALLRWDDPTYGLQEPNSFIPVAEESGLIVDIGAWSLRRAAAFAVRMNRERPRPLVVSVNVSQLQFEYSDVPRLLETVINETGLEPSWLMLELTERILTDNSATMIRTLGKLRTMGFGLSIDDFGTGYSSLGYLEAFPFSEFKIDRTFVSGLDQNRLRQIIVEAMIRLGRELRISVTAEGPETEAELAVLRDLNCPYVQGFIFGRPMTEKDFADLVNRRQSGEDVRSTADGPPLARAGQDTRNAILIDDDSLVREVIGEALEVLGWEVTPAASAEAALAMSDGLPAPRLIVTDVNLGAGMSGFELLPHARRRWPDAGIIVISGRPVEPTALATLREHEIFLTKPASIATLGDAISKVAPAFPEAGPGPAETAGRAEYAATVPTCASNWADLPLGGAVALAPKTARPARMDTARTCAAMARSQAGCGAPAATLAPATAMPLNVAEEVRGLLSRMPRPVNLKAVRLLVAIEPDITILADPEAFRGVLSRVIGDAIADTGASGGRVLLTAVPEGRTIRLIVTDQADAADPIQREAALRHSDNWLGIPDGQLGARRVQDGGVEVTLTLTAA